MAGQRTTFAKIQRERAKQAKQEAKRAAKHGNAPTRRDDDDDPRPTGRHSHLLHGTGRLNPEQLLQAVQELSDQHEAGLLDDDEVEELRQKVIARAG